jgi:hypothetical protein
MTIAFLAGRFGASGSFTKTSIPIRIPLSSNMISPILYVYISKKRMTWKYIELFQQITMSIKKMMLL